jgi:myo-inositol-1(or 4)-monophosphatase
MKKASVSMLRDFHELRFLQTSHQPNSIQRFTECTVSKAEETILNALHRARPEFGVISSAQGILNKSTDPTQQTWLVNVLDGAENFMRAIPYFSISIAVRQTKLVEEEIIMGAVYAPAFGEFYLAEKGSGAWSEFLSEGRTRPAETRLRVSESASACTIVLTDDCEIALPQCKSSQIRMLGSSSIALCYLASGRANKCILALEDQSSTAAGTLIALEAGAIITEELFEEKRMLVANVASR